MKDMAPMFVAESFLEASYCGSAIGKGHEPWKVVISVQGGLLKGSFCNESNVHIDQRHRLRVQKDGSHAKGCNIDSPKTTSQDDSTECSEKEASEEFTSDTDSLGKDESMDNAIGKSLAQQVALTALQRQANNNRWWASTKLPLVCPISNCPICLLPYPPFKLRLPAAYAGPHRLVDGKYLALMMIASGEMSACGHELQSSDVAALDVYMQRCKLGSFRLKHARSLKSASISPTLPEEERERAASDLEKMRNSAQTELKKLQLIQKSRMVQVCREMGNAPTARGKDVHRHD
jgi:hypothetical protein